MVSLRRLYRFPRECTSSDTTDQAADPSQESQLHQPCKPHDQHATVEVAGSGGGLNAAHNYSFISTSPSDDQSTRPPLDTRTSSSGRHFALHIDLNLPAAAIDPESGDQLPASPQADQNSRLADSCSPKRARQAGDGSSNNCSPLIAVVQAALSIDSEIMTTNNIAGGSSAPTCKKSAAMARGRMSKTDVDHLGHQKLGHPCCKAATEDTRPSRPRPNSKKRKKPGIPTTMERMTSCYKGVGKHAKSKQWEARIWRGDVDSVKRKKGRGQLYLGAYPTEREAARVHDLVALKLKKKNYALNFDERTYAGEFPHMESLSDRDYIWSFRRKAQHFTRGISVYKGVCRQSAGAGTKWEGRIGYTDEDSGKRVDIYLGVHPTEVEAARAVDMASLRYHGWDEAITNFAPSQYNKEVVEEQLQRLENKMYSIPAALLQYWSQFQASTS